MYPFWCKTCHEQKRYFKNRKDSQAVTQVEHETICLRERAEFDDHPWARNQQLSRWYNSSHWLWWLGLMGYQVQHPLVGHTFPDPSPIGNTEPRHNRGLPLTHPLSHHPTYWDLQKKELEAAALPVSLVWMTRGKQHRDRACSPVARWTQSNFLQLNALCPAYNIKRHMELSHPIFGDFTISPPAVARNAGQRENSKRDGWRWTYIAIAVRCYRLG